ncbi:hypothetical protein HK096_001786 [Nowakowskiella sp. JEL0078]|nr:hypothetical protein HK096_001786 [Nowakowskiella sp. JEL0078]
MTFNSSVQAGIFSDNTASQSTSDMLSESLPMQIPAQNSLNMPDLNSEDPGLSSSTTASSSASETSNSPTPTLSAPKVNIWKMRLEAQQEKQTKDKTTETSTEQKRSHPQKAREIREERTKRNAEMDKKRKEEEDRDALDGFVKVVAKNTRGKKNTVQRQTSVSSVKSSTINTSISVYGTSNNPESGKKKNKDLTAVQKPALPTESALRSKSSNSSIHILQQNNLQQRTPASPSNSSQITADQNITISESKTASPPESVTDSGTDHSIVLDLKQTYTPAKIVVTHARSENISRPDGNTTLQIDNSELWPSLGVEPLKPSPRTVTHQTNGSQTSRSIDSSTADTHTTTKKNKTFIPFDITPDPTPPATFSGSTRASRGRGGRGRGGRSNNATHRAQRASFSGTPTTETVQQQKLTPHRHSEGHILSTVTFTPFIPANQTPITANIASTAYPYLGIDTAFITPENADLDTVRFWLRQQM